MPTDKISGTRVIVEEIGEDKDTKVTEKNKIVVPETNSPNNETEEKINIKGEKNEKPIVMKEENKSSSNFNLFWIIFPGIMLLGLLMGGIIAYYSGINKLNSSESTTTNKTAPQPTTSVESLPSATPEAKIDLNKYKIKILNGSGIKGEAGKVQTLLEKAGFSIESTGNASKYDYTKTIIQAKEGVDNAFLAQLEKDLSQTYKLDKSTVLKDSETSSIIIVVGSSKNI